MWLQVGRCRWLVQTLWSWEHPARPLPASLHPLRWGPADLGTPRDARGLCPTPGDNPRAWKCLRGDGDSSPRAVQERWQCHWSQFVTGRGTTRSPAPQILPRWGQPRCGTGGAAVTAVTHGRSGCRLYLCPVTQGFRQVWEGGRGESHFPAKKKRGGCCSGSERDTVPLSVCLSPCLRLPVP